jgi:hypothetical protein
VAVVQASDNTIKATLNAYGPKILKDENAVKNGIVVYPQGHWKILTRALKHEVGDLHALRNKLRNESASSARGRKGKSDVVKGLSLIADAYGALRTAVLSVHGGPVSVSKVNAARATDKKGRKLLNAGLKLLGS